jgi:N-methylhydantoinase A
VQKEDISPENQRFEFYVAARYPMEVSEIDMPLRAGRISPDMISQLVSDFHALHEKRYAVSDPESYIECTDWRVLGIGITPRFALKEQPVAQEHAGFALKGKRKASFPELGGFIDVPVYDGNKLGFGMAFEGPAIIEDPLTTTIVTPGSKVLINRFGSYIVDVQ